MISKKDIFGQVSSAFKAKPASFDKRIMHPVREWLFGLTLFLVIVIIGGTQSALMFVMYKNVDTHREANTEPLTRYNGLLVGNVLQEYRERKNAYAAYQNVEAPVQSIETEQIDTASSTPVEEEAALEEDSDAASTVQAI